MRKQTEEKIGERETQGWWKKKKCIRASPCWPRGSGLVSFDLWTGTKDRRTYVYAHIHEYILYVCKVYIYTRDTARSSKLFAREEPSRMLLTWWDRGGGESLGWSQHRETRPGSEGKSFETGRRKVHFGVSSWKWDGAEAKRSFGRYWFSYGSPARPQVSGKGISRIHRVDIGRPTCSLVNRKQFANVPSLRVLYFCP